MMSLAEKKEKEYFHAVRSFEQRTKSSYKSVSLRNIQGLGRAPFDNVKVVILSPRSYHGDNKHMVLVSRLRKSLLPPSLLNI